MIHGDPSRSAPATHLQVILIIVPLGKVGSYLIEPSEMRGSDRPRSSSTRVTNQLFWRLPLAEVHTNLRSRRRLWPVAMASCSLIWQPYPSLYPTANVSSEVWSRSHG